MTGAWVPLTIAVCVTMHVLGLLLVLEGERLTMAGQKSVQVRMTVTVDHPEKRGPTHPVVAAGSKLRWNLEFTRQKDAVAMFDAVLAGGEDCGSEFISRVVVLAENGRGGLRTVRRSVSRVRPLRVVYWEGKSTGLGFREIRRIAPSAGPEVRS